MLKKTGIIEKMNCCSPYDAAESDLLRVHTKEHVNWVKKACEKGIREVGPEAYSTPVSLDKVIETLKSYWDFST